MTQDVFAQLHRSAQDRLSHGKFAEAKALCLQLLEMDPADADSRFLLGIAEDGLGAPAAGAKHVEAAVAHAPKAEYYAHLGRILSKLKDTRGALAAADAALALAPTDALTLDTIGCIYSRIGRHDTAVGLFVKAVTKQQIHPQFRYNLASSLRFLGRFEEAEQHFERAIAAMPGFVRAHTALSSLRKQTKARNHIGRLDQLLTRVHDPSAQVQLRYALAKEHEDLGNYESVFRELSAAGTAQKQMTGYSLDFDRAIFDALRARFPGGETSTGHDSAEPIFVVGMPRTGTTLVERIISSHPDVTAAGELQTLPLLIKRLSGSTSRYVLDADTIERSRAIDMAELGRLYLEESKVHRASSAKFIDKMPLNFLNVGFIAAALPKAKIVCLRRDPMDTVWSNFKHLFASDFSYYNYSYDLLDTAAYYRMFDQLMAHWAAVFPGRVLEVKYESVVADFAPEVRRIIHHVGLPWNVACLRFYENDAAVATPSAVQVRQPVYKDSVGRWKSYGDQLAPVAAYFAANGIAV